MTPRRGRETAIAIALYLVLVFASFLPQSPAAARHHRLRRRLAGERVHRRLERPPVLPRARASLRRQHPLSPTLARWPSPITACCPRWPWRPIVWATGNPVLATNVAVGLVCLLAALGGRRLAMRPRPPAGLGLGRGRPLRVPHLPGERSAPPQHRRPRVRGLRPGRAGPLPARKANPGTPGAPPASCCCRASARTTTFSMARWWSPSSCWARWPGDRADVAQRLPMLAMASLVAALLFAPVAVPYLRSAREQGYVARAAGRASASSTTSRPLRPTSSTAPSARRCASSSAGRTSSGSSPWPSRCSRSRPGRGARERTTPTGAIAPRGLGAGGGGARARARAALPRPRRDGVGTPSRPRSLSDPPPMGPGLPARADSGAPGAPGHAVRRPPGRTRPQPPGDARGAAGRGAPRRPDSPRAHRRPCRSASASPSARACPRSVRWLADQPGPGGGGGADPRRGARA